LLFFACFYYFVFIALLVLLNRLLANLVLIYNAKLQ
jgi:hypothetical protein